MPAVLTELITIYMAVMHVDFFRDLGMKELFCDPDNGALNRERITAAINATLARWPEKYPDLHWDNNKISYSNIRDFALSFSNQIAGLNLEIKK
jgi:hypothetical protein